MREGERERERGGGGLLLISWGDLLPNALWVNSSVSQQGKIANNTFIVMDAYPLPVEGTETRVNAQEAAYPYMAEYDALKVDLKRPDNVIGWYHSHPGYGCWLSGIDVNTQMIQQSYIDPFLAVVVDPNRTISAGKVDIGAFRTYPEGYKSKDAQDSEYQTIPLSKIEDFGAHSSQYYPLEIEHFKSTLDERLLDLLWNKYWVSTLAQSPLFTVRYYEINDYYSLPPVPSLHILLIAHIQ